MQRDDGVMMAGGDSILSHGLQADTGTDNAKASDRHSSQAEEEPENDQSTGSLDDADVEVDGSSRPSTSGRNDESWHLTPVETDAEMLMLRMGSGNHHPFTSSTATPIHRNCEGGSDTSNLLSPSASLQAPFLPEGEDPQPDEGHGVSTRQQQAGMTNDQADETPQLGKNKEDGRPMRRTFRDAMIHADASQAFSPFCNPHTNLYAKKKMKRRKKLRGKQGNARIDSVSDRKPSLLQPNASTAREKIDSILQSSPDPTLQNYLPQFVFLNSNFYTKIKPYRMGQRDLPSNQIEVILRRRAVRKRGKAFGLAIETYDDSTATVNGSVVASQPALPPTHGRSRRLFPVQQPRNASPSPTKKEGPYYEDDSTISSTTISSQLNSIGAAITSQPDETIHNSSIVTIPPEEEIYGDTSLGLKLTIISGRVIIQSITPLDDGRSSPAQQCGTLLARGDTIIAVNGKSLIRENVYSPVSMDNIISALAPLSKPIVDAANKEYSREVRLRCAKGIGMNLLREQDERENLRLEERGRRRKMGLERSASAGAVIDPAADLFGIGSYLAVDQHSGMPMFGHIDRRTINPPTNVPVDDADNADERELETEKADGKDKRDVTTKCPQMHLSVQARIAHEVFLDRQYIRKQHMSDFYVLGDNKSALLRPPTPPLIVQESSRDPSEIRQEQLKLCARVMSQAKTLVDLAERQDLGLDDLEEDEDPLEVASRVCGTASIRTGASRRRWHRGDSVNDARSANAGSASSSNDNADSRTLRSGDSFGEYDNSLLIELAANNEPWKANVLKHLAVYADATAEGAEIPLPPQGDAAASSGFDHLLFGGDVASILSKKKQSLSLPPGELSALLYDLVDLLESSLPDQIFMKESSTPSAPPAMSGDKTVSFNLDKPHSKGNVKLATDFLVDSALGLWLRTFRPLPWKQRRTLWPTSSSNVGDGDSTIMSMSRMDDLDTLSLTSGFTLRTGRTLAEKEKRNLRELVEDLELDQETRVETCTLATFYFTHKFDKSRPFANDDLEEDAIDFVDTYGAYLDIYKCLKSAGKFRSGTLIKKLVEAARYDQAHKEAIKALQKPNVLLFYQPHMLSALLDLIPSVSSCTSGSDLVVLAVSAYPDVQPWYVKSVLSAESGFYMSYLSSLLHHEDGHDAARRDSALVKEFCEILTSQGNSEGFFHIASRGDPSSRLYFRDLPFLLDIGMRMEEFGLALNLANEIISSRRYRKDRSILSSVIQRLSLISSKAVEGAGGELNTQLLCLVVPFLSEYASIFKSAGLDIDLTSELTKVLQVCRAKSQNDDDYSTGNIDACISVISENSPPDKVLQVLSKWDHLSMHSSAFVDAIHTCLIRGAREGVRSELSGSLLRVRRAREEGRRPDLVTTSWYDLEQDASQDEGEHEKDGPTIWNSVLSGSVPIHC